MSDPVGGEWELIEWMRGRARSSHHVPIGMGDDAALIRNAHGPDTLVTTDLLMDGVHFELPSTDPRLIGRKALAVNLSDVAAMAGLPRAAFVSLALPKSHSRKMIEQLFAGLQQLADEFEVTIAGGDTNTWNGPLVINITLLAEPDSAGPVLRRGARVGDRILVTGALGGSLQGRHLTFTPRVREALTLHTLVDLHAMIDLSDGLASDLRHLLHESGVGAVINADSLPIHGDVDIQLSPEQRIAQALGDGEDFELLFTLSDADARRLVAASPINTPISIIGEVTDGMEFLMRGIDGKCAPVPRTGWEHEFNS